jgi:hypothetical protein
MKTELSKMVELTDAELDAVAAGQQTGLINIDVGNVTVSDVVDVDVRNVSVAVAAAVAVLGAAAAGAASGVAP